ncbi:MAG: DUF1489 family protein [Porphyrobacter sp.]|nr:DUF1489 family protein [Porphyrobacter sp.]
MIDHTLVARSGIRGFGQSGDGRCQIRFAPELVLVDPRPRRAHQGWRYLANADARRDLAPGEAGAAWPLFGGHDLKLDQEIGCRQRRHLHGRAGQRVGVLLGAEILAETRIEAGKVHPPVQRGIAGEEGGHLDDVRHRIAMRGEDRLDLLQRADRLGPGVAEIGRCDLGRLPGGGGCRVDRRRQLSRQIEHGRARPHGHALQDQARRIVGMALDQRRGLAGQMVIGGRRRGKQRGRAGNGGGDQQAMGETRHGILPGRAAEQGPPRPCLKTKPSHAAPAPARGVCRWRVPAQRVGVRT